MTEKKIFVYKLFLPLNISDFSKFFLCKNSSPLLKKVTPSFGRGLNPPPPSKKRARGGGCTLWKAFMDDLNFSFHDLISFHLSTSKICWNHASDACTNKKGCILENQAPFINNKTNKEIMKKSRPRSKFLDSRSGAYIQYKPKLLCQNAFKNLWHF